MFEKFGMPLVTSRSSFYPRPFSMKAFALILLIAGAFGVTGCESDMPPEPNRDNPIQRGLRGEGTLKPRDYSDDPFVRAKPGDTY
jgi:hypothetical protein